MQFVLMTEKSMCVCMCVFVFSLRSCEEFSESRVFMLYKVPNLVGRWHSSALFRDQQFVLSVSSRPAQLLLNQSNLAGVAFYDACHIHPIPVALPSAANPSLLRTGERCVASVLSESSAPCANIARPVKTVGFLSLGLRGPGDGLPGRIIWLWPPDMEA